MLKYLTACILLLGLVAQTFSKVVIVLDFYANRDYIAKELCENRGKPKLNCCGKCQLHKKLKQEDKKDEQNPERKAESRSEIFCETLLALTHPEKIYYTIKRTYPVYAAVTAAGTNSACFHPPCA
ncbi:hypothetical protein [Deminuibacter soli]|uniref:Uncharacterized protein n=1 Tax=Deminuibacter soli TaxID=2291815 RepID=A0A3E1NGJ5_9BACT|nr:hypothetical protein [Deminuibacter soli]RFM27086.1 hypothetical protein DXN05_16600 [Deminuibacter soli]